MADATPLSYADAFDLVEYWSGGVTRGNGTVVWLLQNPKFSPTRAAEVKADADLAAFLSENPLPDIGDESFDYVEYSRKGKETRDRCLAVKAIYEAPQHDFLTARKLVMPKVLPPALAIFPGHTNGLAAVLAGAVAHALGETELVQANIRRTIADHLLCYETQLEESHAGRSLLEWLEKTYSKESFQFGFMGVSDVDRKAGYEPTNIWKGANSLTLLLADTHGD